MLGNLIRESEVVPRLRQAVENEIPNTVTLLLGLTIGATMSAQSFLNIQTVIILTLGIIAFISATAGGLMLGKLYCYLSGRKVNPLIGACGISAFPMSARVIASVAKEDDPDNFIIFHAMASNTAGQIGSVVATGMLLLLIPIFNTLFG
jgi:oxaloacetate decarboxylase beta subunit